MTHPVATVFVIASVFVIALVFAIAFLLGTIYKKSVLPAEWELQRRQHEADLKLWDTERRRWKLEVSQHLLERDRWAHDREEFEKERNESHERHKEILKEEELLKEDSAALDRYRDQLKREQDKLARAKADHELEKLGWSKERAFWARDRDDWERERRAREPIPHEYPTEAYWDVPVAEPQCHSYGKRRYSARLWNIPSGWDGAQACKFTPVEIAGAVVYEADECEDNGWWGGVVGHWIIEDGAPICKPWFEAKQDQGCTGSRLRRHEAKVLGIRPNDDWIVMCSTTPDLDYQRPTYCVEKPNTGQRTAVWDHFDGGC